MSDKTKTIVIRGTVDWCKLLGNARPHTGNAKYDKGPYWSIDVTPNDESRELLDTFGLTEKLREPNVDNPKEHRRETYLSLKVLENKSDGTKNKAPEVVDVRGKPWDQSVEIGNGTVADVKVRVVDYGKGVQKGCYLHAMRVLDLSEYEREQFAPLSEDDEYFAEPEANAEPVTKDPFDTDLDDDVPF